MIQKDTGREGIDRETGSAIFRLSTPFESGEVDLYLLCIGEVEPFPDLIRDYVRIFSSYLVRRAADNEEASVLLSAYPFDLIIYDTRIGDLKSVGWFSHLHETGDKTPVISVGTETGELFSAEQDCIVAFSVTGSDISRNLIPLLAEQVQAAREKRRAQKRSNALTKPLDDTEISFEDLFDINEIQRILDEFSEATGVASLITRPDGTPITRPAGFTRLCSIIRNTEIGLKNCSASDAALGKPSFDGPIVQRCLSGGLWGAGAGIVIGDRHVASWLIGQVRNEEQTEEAMRAYARTIGTDEDAFIQAFRNVPSLSSDAFRAVAKVMYRFANYLSELAYKNLLQARVISERETAEDALRRSERNYRDVVENLEDIYYRTDEKGILIEVSDSAARIFGYDSPSELLGLPIDRFWVEPEKRSEFIRKIREEGRVVDYETNVYKKDLSVLPVCSTSTFYRDDTGKILGVVGIIRDISERKKAHEDLVQANDELSAAYEQLAATDAELRLSMERLILQEQKAQETTSFLESLISIANVPIIVWDPSFQITRVNHAFELLVGRSEEEVLGKPLSILISPEKADHTVRLLQTTRDGVRWETVELEIQHRDGSLKTVIWNSATLYDKVGAVPVATIAQGRDITEQRRLERANEEAIAQIQKNLAQLAILNDGIRNPLTIITVYADMLGESATADQIRTQVNNIDSMVTQLDQRWADSEKVLQVIRKHYQIDVTQELGKDGGVTGRDDIPPGTKSTRSAPGSVQDLLIEEVQAQLFRILDSIDALIYVADMDTHELLYLNQQGRSLYGDVIGQKCYTVIRGEENGPCSYCTNHLLFDNSKSLKTCHWEYYSTISGRWYDCRDRAIRWSDGRQVRLEVATDITVRKNAEEELLKTQKRLIDLINFLPDATFAIDRNGKVIIWNRAIEEMTGIMSGSIMGEGNYAYAVPFYGIRRPILIDLALLPDEDVLKNYSSVRQVGDTLVAETRMAHPRGEDRFLWGKATVLKDGEGRIIGAIESIRDITEKRLAEERLLIKEFAIESSLDGIAITDMDGILTTVNPALLRMWGYESPQDVLGKPATSFLPDDVDISAMRDFFKENETWQGEVMVMRRDNTRILVSLSISLIRDTSRNPVGIFASCIDVTKQRQIEDGLEASKQKIQERLKTMAPSPSSLPNGADPDTDKRTLSHIPFGVVITDDDGKITEANPAACRLSGYPLDTLLQMKVSSLGLIKSDDSLLKQVKETGKVVFTETTGKPDESDRNWFVEVVRPTKNRIIWYLTENTGSVQPVESASLREERYNELIENASIPVMIVVDGKIVKINREVLSLTGYDSDDDILFMSLEAFVCSEDLHMVMKTYHDLIGGSNRDIVHPFRIRGKDGRIIWVFICPFVISWIDSPALFLFFRDITEQIWDRKALFASNEKIRLFTGISRHTVFNKLSAVQTFHDLSLKKEDPELIHSYIRYAKEACEQIEEVVRFSREYEKFGLAPCSWQSVFRIVSDAISNSSHPGIIIHADIPQDIEIYADPLIDRVIPILIENAVVHGGSVTAIRFQTSFLDSSLCITCSDDGSGIPDTEKELIFNQGYGKSGETGLFFIRQILSITGISIEENGIPEEGARFLIRVPPGRWRRGNDLKNSKPESHV